MATTKYIGARYMPKFMGVYDATTAYEALSIVDNGSGTTYVANKPVPAGTALTNTEYWSVYGASSGAIFDLQGRMDTAENDIDALEGRMDTAEDDIDSLEGRMGTAEGDITAIQKAMAKRRFIIVGDSYAVGHTPDGDVTSFVTIVKNYLGLDSTQIYNASANYSSFGNTVKFLTQLQAIEDNVDDKDTITDIVVCGGYNDRSSSLADIDTGMANFKTYARATYPNAVMSIVFIGWSKTPIMDSSLVAGDGYTRKVGVCSAMSKYTEAAGKNGFAYLGNVSKCLYRKSYFSSDGFHPNLTGQEVIANYLISLLYKGEAVIPDAYFTASLKLIENGALNGTTLAGSVITNFSKGKAQILIAIASSIANHVTITFDNNWHALGWIDGDNFQCPAPGSNSGLVAALAMINFKYTDNGITKYISAPMSLNIYQNILYYRCQIMNDAGTWYHDAIEAEAIYTQDYAKIDISPLDI